MPKFKKGDKVVRTYKADAQSGVKQGDVYTVFSCGDSQLLLNECFSKHGFRYSYNPDYFELFEEQTEKNIVKEFLTLNSEGKYQLVNHKFTEEDIEVPDCAEHYVWFNDSEDGSEFYKDNFTKFYFKDDEAWCDVSFSKLPNKCKIIWKRDGVEDVKETKYNPLISQSGGSHYKINGVQPVEYTMSNNLSFCQGNIIKYITRYADKNGIEDLEKVIHYTLLEAYFKYGEDGSEELKQRVLKLFNK